MFDAAKVKQDIYCINQNELVSVIRPNGTIAICTDTHRAYIMMDEWMELGVSSQSFENGISTNIRVIECEGCAQQVILDKEICECEYCGRKYARSDYL